MESLIAFWRGHGTKILGAVITLVTANSLAESEIHQLIGDRADLWFDLVMKILYGLLGLGVYRRGFTNSRAAP